MGLVASKTLDLIRNIGKPVVQKQTTTVDKPDTTEGLDLSSLMMMLMFSGLFDQGKNKNKYPLDEALIGLPEKSDMIGKLLSADSPETAPMPEATPNQLRSLLNLVGRSNLG